MRTAAFAIACLGAATAAEAQSRFFVTVGAGAQVSKNTLDRDVTQTFYAEPASVHQHFRMPMGARVEVGAGLSFSRFEVGAAIGVYRRNGTLDVTAGIPHPFFFAQLRPAALSGRAHRAVLDVTVDLSIRLFRWHNLSVAVGVGPTLAQLTQDVATGLIIGDDYPYDTVAIKSFSMNTVTGSGVGAHAFGRVRYPLRRGWSLSGDVRYSSLKAATTMETGASDVRWPAGGVQVVGGLRVFLGR